MKALGTVVFILLLLLGIVALVLPKLNRGSTTSREVAAQVQISTLGLALDAFQRDVGRYPSTQEGLRVLYVEPAFDADRWQGPYFQKRVETDPWGCDYRYVCPGRHNQDGFDLWSFGPDRKDGTEDDIGNGPKK